MSEPVQFVLLGFGALAVILLDWKLGTFGIASERDRHPINFWMGFGLTAFMAILSFAIAIWEFTQTPR